jgi:hypothetical protein
MRNCKTQFKTISNFGFASALSNRVPFNSTSDFVMSTLQIYFVFRIRDVQARKLALGSTFFNSPAHVTQHNCTRQLYS